MSDRAAASETPETAQVSGDQPTLAAEAVPPVSDAAPKKPVGDWTGREVLGRYRVLERLGEGGMGVVYVAEHLSLQKKVAFKIIHPQLSAHEDLLRRFQREALATGQLDHPHIAAAIDFGELPGGGAFMVMPWVRGHSLQVELEEHGKMDFRRAATLCSQIADALSAAHSVGIVHRDLKPDNVLLERRTDGSEAAKVLDFGVASLSGRAEGLSVDARPLTQAGTILGTPGYMSPEQASAGEVDHRTDIYALGVILWELCRGERLFSGDDITQIFAKQFKSVPQVLDLGLSSAARDLSTLVNRMLAWDKHERPSSAAEVRDSLRRIAVGPDVRLPALPRITASTIPRAMQRFPLPAALAPYRAHLPYALVALLVVLVIAFAGEDAPEREGLEPVPAAEGEADQAKRTAKDGTSEKSRSKNQGADEPARALPEKRAPEAEPSKKPESAAAAKEPPRRDEMASAIDNLLNSRSRDSRRTAAKWIAGHKQQAPRYASLLADLELNGRCKAKKAIVAEMATLSDPRVLPALEELADSPRRGCGLLRLNDCYACMRKDLDETIDTLRKLD